jgi:hypothetical protein
MVQTDSGAHSASHPVGVGGDFPGVEQTENGADHSPPSSAKVKNDGAVPPLPHVFMA